MNNNDDLINNILNELDNKAENEKPVTDETPEPSPAEAEPVQRSSGDTPEDVSQDSGYPSHDMPEEMPPQEQFGQPMQPMRSQHNPKKKKKKKKRSRVPGVLILTTFIVAVSIVLSLVIIAFGKDMLGIGKDDSTHLIVVKDGATTEEIAYMLKDEGIIRSPKAFIYFSKLRKSDAAYVPGEHFIKGNMAYETIIQKLTTTQSEAKNPVELTIPEGKNLDWIAEQLEEKKICKAKDFLFTFNSGGLGCDFENQLKGTDNSLKFRRMEGYAFPDTYMFSEDMDVTEVCQKIYFNFNKKMTPERYSKMNERGLTLDQLITFASIVQLEAASPDTMKDVASVFWNRRNDPEEFAGKLQSDPTKNYANLTIKPRLDVPNPTMLDAYNTYIAQGLPPGAICNPGTDAIDAVLDAPQTDYKYFAANIYTAETKFAVSYEEHLANLDVIHAEEAEYEAEQASREAEQAAKEAAQQEGAENAQQ